MKMSALPLTVWLAQILTTCAFQSNLTTRNMDSGTTTTSQVIPEPNKHHMTTDTSAQITTAPKYPVEQSTHGLLPTVGVSGMVHDPDVNVLRFTSSAETDKTTSTFLHKIPSLREMTVSEDPTTVITQKDLSERGTVSVLESQDWKATPVQTTLFMTPTKRISSSSESSSNTSPLTDTSQSTDVTPRPTSTMPTQNPVTPLVQYLTSNGATTYTSTPTVDNYTLVPFEEDSDKSTKKPLLSSNTTAISESQTSLEIQQYNTTQRNITITAKKDSTSEYTHTWPTDTPPIQDLTSDGTTTYNINPTADNYTQVLFGVGSVQSTKDPLLPSNTEAISEGPTTPNTSEPIKENITTRGNSTNTTEKDSTSEHTDTWTTDTPLIQDLTSDGATTYNIIPTADNYTGAPFNNEPLGNTTEYLVSEGQTSLMTVEPIQENNTTQRNITVISEKDWTSEHTHTWTTGTPQIQDLTSDGATIYNSIGSTVEPTQTQTMFESTLSTEVPLATNTTTGMTSEAETTHTWASISASTNTSENISISDTKRTLWPSCMNIEEDPSAQSLHMSRFTCFITIWSLAMAATIFLGATIFLWVRLSVVKKRSRRRGWSLKDKRGSGAGGMEQKSLWAEHNSAERVEFWYANGTTMEADKKGEKKPKERKKKKPKKQTNEEENICIQPRVTLQEISQFWYSNGQVRNGRMHNPFEDF